MRAQLQSLADTTVTLIKGSGGAFEITVDGALRYSKKALGRFPTDEEVAALTAD